MRTAASRIASLVLCTGLLAAACSDRDEPWLAPGRPGGPVGPAGSAGGEDADVDRAELAAGDLQLVSALRTFGSCEELLGQLRAEAAARVGPWGLADGYGIGFGRGRFSLVGDDDVAMDAAAPAEAAVELETVGDQAARASGTNVQEAGVDEPDLLHVEPERVVILAGATLHVVDPAAGRPLLRGSVELPGRPWDAKLLVVGDRALVYGSAEAEDFAADGVRDHDGRWGWGRALLSTVDLSDPAAPLVEATLAVDGYVVSARAVDGVARIVVRGHDSGPAWAYPENQNGEAGAARRNRELAEASTLDDWLPGYDLRAGDRAASGSLLRCEDVHHPAGGFAGFGTVSVLTVPLDQPIGDPQATAVLAGAETVYSSTERLYVATSIWPEPQEWERRGPDADLAVPGDGTYRTDIHGFSIAGDGPARYLASGSLPGHLLNQYAMSEHDGLLRVATTDGPPWGGETDSAVTVLEQQGDGLRVVGQVDGLGKPGERIQGVRFIGTTGYVVTFLETDPLYVIDLSDPRAPRVAGELEIPGFSAYLHPIGDGRLLGLGRDADEDGTDRGLLLSLFDVGDPAAPRRVAALTVADAWSEALWDPHAILWWAPSSMFVVPMELWSFEPQTGEEAGGSVAWVTRVDGDALAEVGRPGHQHDEPWESWIRRSFVVDDALFTLSERGLAAHRLADLALLGELDLAR